MKKVYQDELDIREYLEPEVNNSGKRNDPGQNEKLFLDITKNGPPVTPPKTQENDASLDPLKPWKIITNQCVFNVFCYVADPPDDAQYVSEMVPKWTPKSTKHRLKINRKTDAEF